MIELEKIAWSAGSFELKEIDLTVENGSYAVLMGRTGCGKSSLLEILCGLRVPTGGRVLLAGRDVTGAAPGERRIGYVPQDGALFPTMIVREQLGFGLRIQRRPAEETAEVVSKLARELEVDHLLDRMPEGLSGGERQRVALGRALAIEPEVLLLDEPLSAVDEETRGGLIALLRRTQRDHALTVLHVTHSTWEAEQLADQVFRLEEGKVVVTRP